MDVHENMLCLPSFVPFWWLLGCPLLCGWNFFRLVISCLLFMIFRVLSKTFLFPSIWCPVSGYALLITATVISKYSVVCGPLNYRKILSGKLQSPSSQSFFSLALEWMNLGVFTLYIFPKKNVTRTCKSR